MANRAENHGKKGTGSRLPHKGAGQFPRETELCGKGRETDNAWFPSSAWGGMTAPQYPFPGWGNRQLRVVLIAAGAARKKEELF